MKCNPVRWLWGLLPVLALLWLTVVWEKDPIQEDLRERSQSALTAAGLSWAGTGFDGRDGLLKGLAFREEHPDAALDIVRKVWGVRVVDEHVDLIDLVEKYALSAAIDGSKITLTGYVPNEEIRKTLLKSVKTRFPKFDIDDQTKLARGAPKTEVWLKGFNFGLDRLTQLSSGSFTLSQLDFSIAGEARDFAAFKSAKAALTGAMPDGVTLAKNEIRPPIVSPYTWSAEKAATQLVLAGHVPGEQQREKLFAAAKAAFPSLVIIDRMETAAGAPVDWSTAANNALAQLSKLKNGSAKLKDASLDVSGEAPDEDTANAIVAELKDALPKAFAFTHNITFPEPKPPVVTPFTTSIDVQGEDLQLTGYVPDEDARTQLLDHTRKAFPKKRIVDNLTLGSGAPEGWRRCLFAGIKSVARLGSGKLNLVDRNLTLTAKTQSEQLAEEVPGELRAATTRACDANIDLDLDLPDEPYLTWRADFDGGDTIHLDGEVPDIETLTNLLSVTRKQFPKAKIDNKMTVASGYSAKWQKVAATGINLLSLLRRGEAKLTGQELVISGEAADTAVATAIKDRLDHNLAKKYSGRSLVEVKSDAMIWAEMEAKRKAAEAAEAERQKAEAEKLEAAKAAEEARRKAEEDEAARKKAAEEEAARKKAAADEEARLKTEADEAARQEAEAVATERKKAQAEEETRRQAEEAAAAERKEAEAQAADRRKAQAEEEARRQAEAAAAATAARQQAAEEAKRKAEADAAERKRAAAEANRQKAEAEEAARRQAMEKQVADLKAKENALRKLLESRPLPPKAEACQQKLSEAAKSGVIHFEYGKDNLTPSSYPTLDRLASIANRCNDIRLIVQGHTDSIGQRADNEDLSLRRAASVINYLVSAGVPRDKLDAVGFGEEKPVAPNNSDENRAKNRRIEFTVRLSS